MVNALPVFDCPAYGPFCEGDDAVVLEGEGVYTYNDQVLVEFAPETAGEYLLVYTVTNEFGCAASCEFTIVVNALPVFDCPAYGPYVEGDAPVVFEGTGVYTYMGEVVTGFDPAVAGSYLFVYTVTENGCSASCEFTIVVNPFIPVCPGWVNLQWPPSGTINLGGDYTVYAQIWIDGVTQLVGATPGLSVAIGYCTENTNPSTWTNWVPANFNVDAGNNDEFMANIGAVIPATGVYYYASRFVYNNCETVYGGYAASGGGFWDGINNVSGVLTIEPGGGCINPATAFAGADAAICADGDYLIADATATNYTAVQWYTLTGDGTFDDETMLNPTYTPGTLDLIAGSVELCFTAFPSDQLCEPAVDCMVLTFNALPEVLCPQYAAVCEGAEYIEFGELGTYYYEGEPVTGFDPIAAGDYLFVLTVTNEFGCSASCEFTIVVNPLPVADCPVIDAVCEGSEFVTFPVVEGGVYTFEGETVTGFEPAIAGDYMFELTVTNEFGCSASCEFTVVVNPLPTYSYELSATEICYGSEVTYTEYFTGTAPWTVEYYWNGELETFTTSENPSITTEVLYETSVYEPVSVTDGNGCTVSVDQPVTITVNPLPTYSYELSATDICYGEEVTYTEYFTGTAPWTVEYYWNGELETFTTSENPSITTEVLFETSTYVPISVTDGTGCSSSFELPSTITVHPLPVFDCPVYGPFCEGFEGVTFEGEGVYTFNGEVVLGLGPVAAGNYLFVYTVTSEFGCSASCEFTIVVNPLPVAVCEDFDLCENAGVYEFPAIEYVEYFYNDELVGSFDPSVGAGEYMFTKVVGNEFGCTDQCTFTITVLPIPVIVADPEDVSELYGGVAVFTVGVQFADSYQWYGPAGIIDGETGMSLTIFDISLANEGEYYVAVTNECETINSAVATLDVLPWTQTISLPSKVNGVSTYLDLIDNSVASNVAPLGTNLQYFSFMRPDQTYVPGGVSFPWTEERGARLGLKTTWPTSINVVGWPTLGTEVTLPAGWSLVPVWSQGVVSADDVFGPLGSNLVLAMGITYANAYWPAKNIYTLENLVPGRAYLVNLVASATLDFDVPIVDKATTDEVFAVNNTTWNDVEMTGTMHAIAITTEAFAQLERRDVIGIFNQNGTIAGMVELDNLNDNVFVSVYADNSFTDEIEGFVNGDMMTFKVYRNGEEIDATASFDASMPNTNIFNEEGISVINGLKLGATSINEVTSELNAQIFPNPAKDVVNIQTNFEIQSLKVVNYVGQVVFDRPVDQMNIQINTSNFVPGMYFVQIQSVDGTVITKRLTIN